MRILWLWLYRILLLVPAALIVATAVPRFQSGLAVDAVFPAPVYVIMELPLPVATYRTAADVLSHAGRDDGPTIIQQAEFASLAGAPRAQVLSLYRDGLSHSPASVRGWTLLAEQLEPQDKALAGEALSHSLLLGPYEYFVAGRRARDAALLWDALSADGKEAALRQTRLLWSAPLLNHDLDPLLRSQGGPNLLNRAFKDNPDDLRALNRYVAALRRGTIKP